MSKSFDHFILLEIDPGQRTRAISKTSLSRPLYFNMLEDKGDQVYIVALFHCRHLAGELKTTPYIEFEINYVKQTITPVNLKLANFLNFWLTSLVKIGHNFNKR